MPELPTNEEARRLAIIEARNNIPEYMSNPGADRICPVCGRNGYLWVDDQYQQCSNPLCNYRSDLPTQ